MKVFLKIPILFLSALLLAGCSKDPEDGPIYIAANGVTITCDTGLVGDTFEVNGITYTIVDETMLRMMVNNGDDVTKVFTSRITNMSGMFSWSQFNQPIGNWDVGNVTSMFNLFIL